ncbi:MAG: hypothetical protein JWR26_614 [Pedosphaera sp.]|nr:hypothetical protein [Pedosphaera sp.]
MNILNSSWLEGKGPPEIGGAVVAGLAISYVHGTILQPSRRDLGVLWMVPGPACETGYYRAVPTGVFAGGGTLAPVPLVFVHRHIMGTSKRYAWPMGLGIITRLNTLNHSWSGLVTLKSWVFFVSLVFAHGHQWHGAASGRHLGGHLASRQRISSAACRPNASLCCLVPARTAFFLKVLSGFLRTATTQTANMEDVRRIGRIGRITIWGHPCE